MSTVILKGSTIGDNVVIGANSVVSGHIPLNCIALGSPAKVVIMLEPLNEKNGSTDGTSEQVRKHFSAVHLIRGSGNL